MEEYIDWLDVKIGMLEDQYKRDREAGSEQQQAMTHSMLRAYRDARKHAKETQQNTQKHT